MKIATHDSATGEKGKGLLSWILTPFARTQSKTIKEQYEAGCRLFDIRIKQYNGIWRCAHGLWKTKRDALDIISEINEFEEQCGISITYEGKPKHNEEFLAFVDDMQQALTHIAYGYLAVKYGEMKDGQFKYMMLRNSTPEYLDLCNRKDCEQAFLPLDGRSWHTYVPIPWLWDRIYKRPHVFDNEHFKFVDFL